MPSCAFCKFSCKYESNFKSHLNSKKHKENIENKNLCDGCFKKFSTKSSKVRHEKTCKIMQTINNTNIETQNNTNNNTTNNTTNNNITNNNITNNTVNNYISLKSLVSEIEELVRKQTTDCFQKLLLNEMASEKYDLMDYIEKFDTKLNKAREDMINDHNMNCKVKIITYKSEENGLEDDLIVDCTPLSHPNYKFDCKHVDAGFKLDEAIVSKILTETLLDADDKIVITHDNNIQGKTDFLFKHRGALHTYVILLEFLNKSNKKEICNLSNNFKPLSIIENNYPEYYDKLEEKAINIIQAYSKKTKRK